MNTHYIVTYAWSKVTSIGGDPPSARNNQATSVVGYQIFIHGGHDGTKWLADLYIFDTEMMEWVIPLVGGEAPSSRACHTISKLGRKLFMFG